MIAQLCFNESENNTIKKKYTVIDNVACTVKGDLNIISPVLIINYNKDDINQINYVYIAEWSRYYFIDSMTALTGGRYEILCSCDVLETFKESILKLDCIVADTEKTGKNLYLPSDVFMRNVKNTTTVIQFPTGLAETGEFILITAGG